MKNLKDIIEKSNQNADFTGKFEKNIALKKKLQLIGGCLTTVGLVVAATAFILIGVFGNNLQSIKTFTALLISMFVLLIVFSALFAVGLYILHSAQNLHVQNVEMQTQQPVEYRDLYDENRKLTGEKVAKGQKFADGRYIVVVMVFIENSKGQLLLQKRSVVKGGKWATTGGHPTTGQSSIDGICQEIKEEIGLDVDKKQLKLIRTVKTPKTFVDLYYMKSDVDVKDLTLQKEEVQDVGWFSKAEIKKLIENDEFFDRHYEPFQEFLKWKEKNKSVKN